MGEGDRENADRGTKTGGKMGDVLPRAFGAFPINPAGFYSGFVRVVT